MDDTQYREAIAREIVLTRTFDAPPERVFDAWTDPESIPAWYGPDGYTCETRSIDITVDGRWCFDMIAPDGQRFSNRMTFLEIARPSRLVLDHGEDVDDDPNRFHVTVTFDEQADGRTVLTMRQLHPSPQRRAATISFGAVELGYQTLGKLAARLASEPPGGE